MPKEEDLKVLEEMIDKVEKELQKIIIERTYLLRKDVEALFPGPWPEVQAAIARGRRELYEIDWKYVEGVGLAGRQLVFKKKLFDIDLKSQVIGRFLGRANSFLGSLSKAIPVFEVVKEYKEQVECSVEDLNRHY